MKTIDLYWLAGIFEGEGWFGNRTKGKPSPSVCVAMTDKDVVDKIASLIITGRRGARRYTRTKGKHKTQYWIVINGCLAIQWMFTLYPLLGKRRREKIGEVVKYWKSVGTPSERAKASWAKRKAA